MRRRLRLEQLETRVMLSTYYVAPNGNDDNPGTQASPWATPQIFGKYAQPGDTMIVEAGKYAGFIFGWDPAGTSKFGVIAGTAGNPITIEADPNASPGSVIINHRNHKTASGIDLEPGCNYINITGFTIENTDASITHYGIKVAGSNFVDILNNTVHGVGLTGVFTAFASDGLIQNNLCYNNGEHGIYASNSPQNEQILNNTSHNNANGGIQVNADVTQGGPGTSQNLLVAGNIIYNNGRTGGGALNFDGLQNSVVENNLLYNNHSSGIVLYMFNASAGSINNIIVNNTVVQAADARPALNNNTNSYGNYFYNDTFLGDMLVDSTSTPAAFSNNVLLTGYVNKGSYQFPTSILSTPAALFANYSSEYTQPDDFQLSATSPAIGAGTSTDAPSTDIVGNARPTSTGYDIGAYQYQVNQAGFILAPASTRVTAGNSLNITVTATVGDVLNTGYLGTVHFTSSDGQAGLPADYTFTSSDQGVHTFSVTLKTAAGQLVTATDATSSSDAQSTLVNVNHAATSSLVVTRFPVSTMAGTTHSLRVTAEDAYGNIVTDYAGTAHFTSTDPQAVLPADYTFTAADAGVKTFTGLALDTSGSRSISVTDQDPITGTITSWVRPGPATSLVLFKSGSVTAGTPFTVTVIAHDQYGNKANSYLGTIHFTSSDPNPTLPGDYTFTSADGGRHVFTLGAVLTVSPTQSITATDTATSTITGLISIRVHPAAATHFLLRGPSSVTAGVAFTITVVALDQFGNRATGYLGTVHFTSTDPNPTLPGDYSFTSADAGRHVFTSGVVLTKSGTQSITATDTTTSSITGTISRWVKPGPATHFRIKAPVRVTSGVEFSITVIALDQYDNKANGYLGTVDFTSTDLAAILPFDYQFTSGDAGKHVFTVTLFTLGTMSLSVTDTSNPTIFGTDPTIRVVASASDFIMPAVSLEDSLFEETGESDHQERELLALDRLPANAQGLDATANALDVVMQGALLGVADQAGENDESVLLDTHSHHRLAAIGVLFAAVALHGNRPRPAERKCERRDERDVQDGGFKTT